MAVIGRMLLSSGPSPACVGQQGPPGMVVIEGLALWLQSLGLVQAFDGLAQR